MSESRAIEDAGRWSAVRRVLCVRLDTVGDVLMTTPALRAVAGGGRRHVTLLTSPPGAEAARFVPDVDDVVVYEAPWMKPARADAGPGPDLNVVERLRAARFDAAVIFTVYSQSALPAATLCHLAGIPLRLAHVRERVYELLSDAIEDPEPARLIRHEVQRQLDLVAAVGWTTADHALSFRVGERARDRARRLLANVGAGDSARWVAVHAGATAPSRRYPVEGFIEVATRLARDDGVMPVFVGGPEDLELVESIRERAAASTASVAGRTSLEELAAVLELAPLLVANNSGPVHVAAAVGTPVVDLYALTNPQHTPWGVPNRVLSHHVPCRWCYASVCPEGHHRCLRLVTVEQVVQAARELLAEATRERAAAPRVRTEALAAKAFKPTP